MDDRGHGGGLVVSVLAFYSDNPSSNPTGYLNFRYKKMKMNEKEAGVAPPPKKNVDDETFMTKRDK